MKQRLLGWLGLRSRSNALRVYATQGAAATRASAAS